MARPVLHTLKEIHRTVSQQFILLDELYRTRQSRALAFIPQDLARLSSVADSLSFHIGEISDPASPDYLDIHKEPRTEHPAT